MTPEMMLAKMLSNTPAVVEKTASVAEVDTTESDAMEKLAWAEEMGRDLAREEMSKVAALPAMGSLLQGAKAALPGIKGSVQSGLGKGMLRTMQAGAGTRAAVGAGAGAALGGVSGALKNPGVDPATGQQRSRLGNVASGMAGGAALGAGAGLGARKAIGAVATGKGAVGQAARGAMGMGATGAKDYRQVKALGALAGEGRQAGLGAAARQNTAAGPAVRTKGGVPGATAPTAPAAPQVPNPAIQPSLGKTLDQIRQAK
jgi:hypothetical protein